ncbi:uncharacterized protein LOC110850395 isoform X2 [Folsomia candida]|uniref:uncharacterized protein LOC110850395 isoform X2 n=1 Tax=Folsomia candida TaxID=158441 RepID=UPI001604C129|nr:uncharacterized protein LOC110850395 isoform X2 [Folsomia candida]
MDKKRCIWPDSKRCLLIQKFVTLGMFVILTSTQIWAISKNRINFTAMSTGFVINYVVCLTFHYVEVALIAILDRAVQKKSLYLLRCWYLARNAVFSVEVTISMTHTQLYFGKLEPQYPISGVMPTTIYWIWGWWAYLVFDMICLIVHIVELEAKESKCWTIFRQANIGRIIYAQALFYFIPLLHYIYIHSYQFVDAFLKPVDKRPEKILLGMYAAKVLLLLLLFPLSFIIYRGIQERDISKVAKFYVLNYILVYPMVLMVNIRSFLEGKDADNSFLTFLIEMVYYFIQYQILNFLVIELVIQFKLPTPKFVDLETMGKEFHKLRVKENQAFFNSVRISARDLKLCDEPEVGRGQFGKVYKGVLFERQMFPWIQSCFMNRVPQQFVAIKVLKQVEGLEYAMAVMKELTILRKVGSHRHLVKFLGCCTWTEKKSDFSGIVLEYCASGSLMDYLRSIDENGDIDKRELLRFSKETAEAMVFLADKKIVHADLATRNILLDGERRVKLSDFGMSLQLYYYQVYQTSIAEVFPFRWMAPESLSELHFSTKTDSWTFGVVLWEIWTLGATPFVEWQWSSNFVKAIIGGLRLEKPELASDLMYHIMRHCWQVNPASRPDFPDLFMRLSALAYHDVQDKSHNFSYDKRNTRYNV